MVTPCQHRFLMTTRRYALILEPVVFIQRLIRLRDSNIVFLIRRQVTHVFRHAFLYLVHFPVRRFHKSELIDARIVGKRTDQADVRTFRRLNRAHTPIMGIVNVAHLKACALTGKTARPQCR